MTILPWWGRAHAGSLCQSIGDNRKSLRNQVKSWTLMNSWILKIINWTDSFKSLQTLVIWETCPYLLTLFHEFFLNVQGKFWSRAEKHKQTTSKLQVQRSCLNLKEQVNLENSNHPWTLGKSLKMAVNYLHLSLWEGNEKKKKKKIFQISRYWGPA